MGSVLRDNGLSITVLLLFAVFLSAQTVTGRWADNEERAMHGQRPLGYVEYLRSGHSLEAVFENWESEFFQMGFYVVLTVFLYQRGSSESKDPDAAPAGRGTKGPGRAEPARAARGHRKAAWRERGGWRQRLYEHSLSLAFMLLFLGSFIGHAVAGVANENEDRVAHGLPPESVQAYVTGPRFWFESFQNWQSEFLAVAAIVLLSIGLREKGSPESKPVEAPNRQTGGDE